LSHFKPFHFRSHVENGVINNDLADAGYLLVRRQLFNLFECFHQFFVLRLGEEDLYRSPEERGT